jgi:hypothetical protein
MSCTHFLRRSLILHSQVKHPRGLIPLCFARDKVTGAWHLHMVVMVMTRVCPEILWHSEYKRWLVLLSLARISMLASLLHGALDESGEARHLSNYCCRIFREREGWGGEIALLSMVLWKGNRKLNGRFFFLISSCYCFPRPKLTWVLVVWRHYVVTHWRLRPFGMRRRLRP